MSETEEEKKKAIKDLHIALKALSQKNALPLRVRAMVLAAIRSPARTNRSKRSFFVPPDGSAEESESD